MAKKKPAKAKPDFATYKKDLETQIAALQQQLSSAGKLHAEDEFKNIFKKHPVVKKFGWPQYTPYFNDGDTCEFGVDYYPESIVINDISVFDVKDKAKKTADDKALIAAAEDISKLLSGIPESSLEDSYGEGMVVVTPAAITTEEYDHD